MYERARVVCGLLLGQAPRARDSGTSFARLFAKTGQNGVGSNVHHSSCSRIQLADTAGGGIFGPTTTCEGTRRALLWKLLTSARWTATDDNAWKEMLADIPSMSRSMDVRTVVTGKVVLSWLRGRPDLKPCINLLVDATYLGWGCFATVVTALANFGATELLQDLARKRRLYGDHIKVNKWLKTLGGYLRAETTHANGYADSFGWQYVVALLGRYDHEFMDDVSDMQERTNYDVLRTMNMMSGHWEQCLDEIELECFLEGEKFALCGIDNVRKKGNSDFDALETRALTDVPTGSYPQDMRVPASAELPPELKNKKVGMQLLTPREAHMLFYDINEAQSWGRSHRKTEVAKQRNLNAGSAGMYYHQATLSSEGESTYLSRLENTPIEVAEYQKRSVMEATVRVAKNGYVACRDYANFNIVHRKTEMQAFYFGMRRRYAAAGMERAAFSALWVASALDDYGVIADGVKYKWEHGLMSGWRHTMLINTVLNVICGRVARRLVEEKLGWVAMAALHTGDDSVEVYDQILAGPLVQAGLDTIGKQGQPSKQEFACERGNWMEFLRILYTQSGGEAASAMRAVGSFVGKDTQSGAANTGGQAVAGLIDAINQMHRRTPGGTQMRLSDVGTLLGYWATSIEQMGQGRRGDWRVAFLPIESGGLGQRLAAWPRLRAVGQGRLDEEKQIVDVPPALAKRSAAKLAARVSRDIAAYHPHYTAEFTSIAERPSMSMENVGAGKLRLVNTEKTRPVQRGCEAAELVRLGMDARDVDVAISDASGMMENMQNGAIGNAGRDLHAEELAVGTLFAGSRRLAMAYMRDHPSYTVGLDGSAMAATRERGLRNLAGNKPEAWDAWIAPQTSVKSEWSTFLEREWHVYAGDAHRLVNLLDAWPVVTRSWGYLV